MNIFLVGLGGAGNKAVINALESEVVTKDRVLLINTTLSDIPEKYFDISVKFGSSRGGCGKERSKAKSYMLEALKGELQNIDILKREDIELVVLATSTEGGTGSGSTLLLSQYITQVLGKPVQVFAFTGFEEDGRGLKNTVEFFQDLDANISVQCISNNKFIDTDNMNKLNAEKLANDDFSTRLKVLSGYNLIDSDQNIDNTDLFKVSTQTGFTVANRIMLPKLKNVDQYNKIVKEALDNDQSLDTTKTVKRLAMIVNASEETIQNIDFYWTKFKEKFGHPFEVYTHVQYDNNVEYIEYIASGLELPLEEVKGVYNRYIEQTELVNKKRDTFSDQASELRLNQSDSMFDLDQSINTINANDFFSGLGKEPTVSESNIDQNSKYVDDIQAIMNSRKVHNK